MIRFTTGIFIERTVEEVFAFVANAETFPRWNSAVRAVRKTSAGPVAAGSTYLMERELPGGPARNQLEVVEHAASRRFTIRTTTGRTPFVYTYSFAEAGAGTELRLDAEAELGGVAQYLGSVAARVVKRGVDANLEALRQLLT